MPGPRPGMTMWRRFRWGLDQRDGICSALQQVEQPDCGLEVGSEAGAPAGGLGILAPALDLEILVELGGAPNLVEAEMAFEQPQPEHERAAEGRDLVQHQEPP